MIGTFCLSLSSLELNPLFPDLPATDFPPIPQVRKSLCSFSKPSFITDSVPNSEKKKNNNPYWGFEISANAVNI